MPLLTNLRMIVAWILAVSHEAASAGLEMSVWADFGLCVSIVIYSLQASEGQHLSSWIPIFSN
jgi:hypothetical protein